MGEDEALKHLKKVLADSHPNLVWVKVCSKYQETIDAKDYWNQSTNGDELVDDNTVTNAGSMSVLLSPLPLKLLIIVLS